MVLDIKNLGFYYDENAWLFRDFNLKIKNEGQITALIGQSGSGKSTLLSLIYGLYHWQEGEIFFKGKKCLGPKGNLVPGEKEMKLVAQNYDLTPYATVGENVGQFISNIDLAQKRKKIQTLLEIVGLEDFSNRKAKFLSGGEMQRVAIARALSVEQKFILLDEPFSNLDYFRKAEIRENLFNYTKEKGISMFISSHEIQEIMPWMDEIVILEKGKIIEQNSPFSIYQNPKNENIARLFGEVNIFSDEEKKRYGLNRNFFFPHQISIFSSENENTKKREALVLESRFSGAFYRNILLFDGKKLKNHTPFPLVLGEKIFIDFV